MRTALLPLLAALCWIGSAPAGHAALSELAGEFLVRDCVARFGHARVRACELVARSATRPGTNPTRGACLATLTAREVDGKVARKLCDYYFQER